jgi:UDP-N-acetyl-D-glucosamine dehydrogenase
MLNMNKVKKNIVIQGLGFVGSAMAIAVASKLNDDGRPIFHITGVDLPSGLGQERIDLINAGRFPFITNDKTLNNELQKAKERGNLTATSDSNAYSKADIVLVSINCDFVKENGKEIIALDTFTDSIREIAENISEDTLVIIESTVPPGTCEKIIYPIFQNAFNNRKLDINKFFLAHSYERVMPGDKYFDSIINYWRVYSGINDESADRCESFLSKVINVEDYPLTRLGNTIASETGKLLENSYRAVNIAFIEEWGRFAEDSGVDLYEVINAIRIRPTHSNIRQPGFGVGGYCLTKDPIFAKIAARDILKINGHDFPFSSQAIEINNKMPLVTLNKLKKYFNGSLKGKNILLLGVTYRQDVGDTRFSPSEIFFKSTLLEEAKIRAYDPLVTDWDEVDISMESNLPNSTEFDAIVFAVPHKEFNQLDLTEWVSDNKVLLFDANNVLTEKQVTDINKNKFNYMSIGRG